MSVKHTAKMRAMAWRIRSLTANVKRELKTHGIESTFYSYIDTHGGKLTYHDLVIGQLCVMVRPVGYRLTYMERAYIMKAPRVYVQYGALDIVGLVACVGKYAKLDTATHWGAPDAD